MVSYRRFLRHTIGLTLIGCFLMGYSIVGTALTSDEAVSQAPILVPQTERPGHVFLADGMTQADYLYRAFVQIPVGIAWGPDDHLYIADWTGRHVVRLAADETMDDMGIWRNPNMWLHDGPRDVAFDSAGNLYVNDHAHIYVVGVDGNVSALPGIQGSPIGRTVFSPSNELYYADRGQGRILKVGAAGVSEIVATGIENAEGLAFGLDGVLYVSQMHRNRVVKVDVSTGVVSDFFAGSLGNDPIFLAVDVDGDIWIRGSFHLYQVAPDGTEKPFIVDGVTYSGDVSRLATRTAGGIAFDDQGRLWIASYNSKLMRLDPTGQASDRFSFTVVNPGFDSSDLATDPNGEVYAYNENAREVLRISSEGEVQVIHQLEAGGRVGLAADDQGDLYMGQSFGEISRLDASGALSHYAWLMSRRMTMGADGYLYAVVGDYGRSKSIVRITDVDTYTTLINEVDGVPLGPGEVHVAAAPETGLYISDETHRKLYYVSFEGEAHLVADVSSVAGGGPSVLAVSPMGDIFFIPHGPYKVYRIHIDGSIDEYAMGVWGDPWGMVVSPDGRWLYVAESGAIDKIPIPVNIHLPLILR